MLVKLPVRMSLGTPLVAAGGGGGCPFGSAPVAQSGTYSVFPQAQHNPSPGDFISFSSTSSSSSSSPN